MKNRGHRVWLASSVLTLLITGALLHIAKLFQSPNGHPETKAEPDQLSELADNFSAVPAKVSPAATPPQSMSKSAEASAADLHRATPLLHKAESVKGQPVLSLRDRGNPQTLKGRTVKLDVASFSRWEKLAEGSEIDLPGFEEDTYTGSIVLRVEDNGWLRFGGTLKDNKGTFSLNIQSGQLAGTIKLPTKGVGLELCTERNGEVVLVERLLSRLVCWQGPPQVAAAQSDGQTSSSTPISSSQIPQINTRPGSSGLIYLHFSGGRIQDTEWNAGLALDAAPSNLSADAIREVVSRVAEDYAPFDMAISTIAADYQSALPGRRMRVIITPTNFDASGAGGLASIGSWLSSGILKSSTIPAWVFNATAKTVAEAVSHEVGHTLGLHHHGVLSPAYVDDNGITHPAVPKVAEYFSGYDGLGGADAPTSWAPIMGNSNARSLTQWCKGEYPNANNSIQDDVAIIAEDWNKVGFRTEPPGSKAAQPSGFTLLPIQGGTFSAGGVLRKVDVPNRYQFATFGGSWAITAKPATPQFTNVDLQLELWRQSPVSGAQELVAKSNPPELLESFLKIPDLAGGTYQIVVRSAGSVEGENGIYRNGYSPYGSLGPYQISGILENPDPAPTLAISQPVKAMVGNQIQIPMPVSKGAEITGVSGLIPPGVSWNSSTKTLEGTPSKEGHYEINFTLQSDLGNRTQSVQVFVDTPDLPLPVVDGIAGAYSNSPSAPWVGKLVAFKDLTMTKAAASGRVLNGGSTRLRLIIPGKRTVSFWWKTSSEAGHDGLECRLNGTIPRDLISGNPLKLSGKTDWVLQKLRVENTSRSILEFAYAKDSTLTEGDDRGWVTKVEVGTPPIFRRSPVSTRLKPIDQTLVLSAVVENADAYQWKKDGIALAEESKDGHVIAGTKTQTLSISGMTAADSGGYTLEASNAFDTVSSRRADVIVPAAPSIGNPTSPISPLKVGDPLILGVNAVGATPYISLWKKDGRTVRRVSGTNLKMGNASASMSGTYSVTISNSFGTSASKEIPVTILPEQ
jgi:Metallo-peptidase family M12B Reprolysin-like